MAFDISPYLSGGRHVVTAATAFAAGMGVHSLYGVPTDQVAGAFDHLWNGISEISIFVGTVAPIAMGIWATIKGTMASKVADVHAAAPHDLAVAVQTVAPAVLLDAAAGVPGVTQITASPAMAQATESPKVVS